MKNGSGSSLFLAALIFLTSGCSMSPPQLRGEASPGRAGESPNVRYQVDAARKRVWWISGAGVHLHDATTPQAGIVLTVPNWLWVGAPHSCPPDLTLGPKGEVVISSNIVPTLWRIDPETLAVSEHPLVLDADTDKDVGFTEITYSAGHAAFFAVSGVHGSLWRIDPLLGRAQKVTLSAPIRQPCGLAAWTERIAHVRVEGAQFSE